MKNKTGVILLSGGLDSYLSLILAQEICDIKLALTFDYGQKAFREEKEASEKIAKEYNVSHKVIKLPFLKDLINNALTDENNTNFNDFKDIWIPNRNGLFLNIAACFCDKENLDYIIIGANKEEAEKFSDNSKEFIKHSQDFFKYSTQKHPKILAPCQSYDKIEIINQAIDNNLNFSLLKSCYNSIDNTNKKHCGKCMSCKYLYEAIKKSKKPQLLKEIF